MGDRQKHRKRRHPAVGKHALAFIAIALGTTCFGGPATAHLPDTSQISIATQLKEVQHGNIDGQDYLTLNIGGHEVGPSACRSNILRMNKGGSAGVQQQMQIEAVAISAVLTRTTVMIVVPLGSGECIDGKPTFTDLYKLAPSL